MSYSRWSRSKWYIFWTVSGQPIDPKTNRIADRDCKEDEKLSVWTGDIPDFTYSQIKLIMEKDAYNTIPGYEEGYIQESKWFDDESKVTDEQYLKEIFEQWIKDVDEHWEKKGEIK